MTPWAELKPLDLDWIACRTVADVAELMIRACATYLLVIGQSPDGAACRSAVAMPRVTSE